MRRALPPSLARELRATLLLALPLILAQLAQMSMSLIDTLMVGRLGQEALAGIALGGSVYTFALIIGMGVMFAVGPTVSQAYGAGDHAKVGGAVRASLVLAFGLSVPAGLLFWQIGPLLRLVGQEEVTAALATRYLHAIAWGYLPALWLTGLRGLLEGLARPRPVMVIAFLGVALNIIANYALIFGHFGFPALGLVGSGWASALVYWSMFGAAAFYVHRALPWVQLWRRRALELGILRELLRLGWPIGLTLGFETGLFSATAVLMGLFGTVQLAAHQIAIQSASFTFMVLVGLAAATAVRVGQAAGRRERGAVRRAGGVGIALSAAFMLLTALTFWLLPERVVGLYLDIGDPANAEVARTAARFLAFAAAFQVFDGLQVSAAGALRGLKDTRAPMLISLASYWGVGLTTGVLLAFYGQLAGQGLWLGLVVGLFSAALLLTWRFHRATRPAPLPAASLAGGVDGGGGT
jgi:MATE family multidrug resistance protein